jgi:damage-control phosphatase, subfamily I
VKTYPDCIPCGVRQALEASRMVSDDRSLHEKILRETMKVLAEMDYSLPPPAIAREIHRLIHKYSGVEDVYHEAKRRFNSFVLDRLDRFKSLIKTSEKPFETALRLAIAGNVIDFGVRNDLEESEVESTINQALEADLDKDTIQALRHSLKNAGKTVYLGDNAGEIIFDRLFIETIMEELGPLDICFVVRGGPILNDATREDAAQAGIDKICRVADTGCNAPGCLLNECSAECLSEIESADLVISKGQGNYETLSELEQETFFLLKVKCRIIARDIGAKLGQFILRRQPCSARSV